MTTDQPSSADREGSADRDGSAQAGPLVGSGVDSVVGSGAGSGARPAAGWDDPFAPPAAERRWILIARALASVFAERAAALDESGELPMDNLRALHASGLDVAMLPQAAGGEGLSMRTFGEVLRIISGACPSTGVIWLMHVGAAVTLVSLGDPETSAYYAAELKAGSRFANALSEPTSGNMFLVPMQNAEPTEGGFRLAGAKRFVSGCEVASHYLVNALVDGVPTFFGVDRDESISFVPIWDTMGLRATRSQLVSFDDTLLRADRRCRPPGPGDPNPIGIGLAMLSVGIAEAAFAAMAAHARGRVIPTTGAPLSAMQWVTFEAAEMHVRIAAAHLLAAKTTWLADVGSPAMLDAAIEAKLYANEVARQVADLGVRVGGGSGYLRTSPIQRHFRDAQAGGLMAYSVEVCKDVVGRRVLDAP
ncbi:MAG: acyl-CoA dehydrogenase family protein [Frankia sp.]